jgi:hypothetical protein
MVKGKGKEERQDVWAFVTKPEGKKRKIFSSEMMWIIMTTEGLGIYVAQFQSI